jgi:predicted transcriptional regulator
MENSTTDTPFQTMREVDDYLSGDAIVCLICGKGFQRLNSHLQRMHQVPADDYHRRFGIPFGRALATVSSRAKSGAAMTPERIEQFMRASLSSPIRDPAFPRGD